MWIVDRFENELVVLENDETREIRVVNKEILPSSIHEGSVLKNINYKYIEDMEEEINRRKIIEDRFKKLRND